MNTGQIIFLIVFSAIVGLNIYGPQIYVLCRPVAIGLVLGLVFGDVKTGLYIGGSLELMSMGVVGLAGASVPDYMVASLIAVPIGITTGGGYEIGISVGIPVAMLGSQLDIIHKILNGFVARKMQDYCKKREYHKMMQVVFISPLMQALKYILPVAIFAILGSTVVEAILSYIPAWLMNGLSVAGKILPVVGISILLHYMPVKKHFAYLIIGFIAYAYLKIPMFGVALLGLSLAVIFYQRETTRLNQPVASAGVTGGMEDE